jgi:hypothetical protein
MICNECKRQIGAHASRHAHGDLSPPGDSVPAAFQTQRYQKLYHCKVCRSILSRGRNTGWTQAGTVLRTPAGGVPKFPSAGTDARA